VFLVMFGRTLCLSTLLAAVLAACTPADILLSPKTLVDRAIEARSADDIAVDNEIVIKVNSLMAELGTIKASTEIYEQKLLITGLFDDKRLYQKFLAGVKKIKGVKKLYWHVRYMSPSEQETNKRRLMDWSDALVLDARVGINLFGADGVADVNYRVAVDPFGMVYLLGRARSWHEHDKALNVARETKDVRRVVDLVQIRA